MKNINPPPTLPVLPSDDVSYATSGVSGIYDSTMVDLSTRQWLTALGINFDVKRPPILFSNDDRWRAIIKVLAFNHRHTRDAVRKVMELLLHPIISQVTVLDREYIQNIVIDNTLDILSGADPANVGDYVLTGVTPHELIFPSGTFPVVPDFGPITYEVGLGPVPIVGPTMSAQGRIYVANDGTERFADNTISFINTHAEDLLTKLNRVFPQFGGVIFDKNSPVEETKQMAFYGQLQSGLMKLTTGTATDLAFTHPKYQPIRSSLLAQDANRGDLSISILNSTNFLSNAAPVDALLLGDSVTILDGVNAGIYAISAIDDHRIEINTLGVPLTVTGKDANNHYKIIPAATPAGAKGTVFGTGGVTRIFTVGPTNFAVFRDDAVTFTTQVDPDMLNTTGYAVRINRGELTEEVVYVRALAGTQLDIIRNPASPLGQTSLLAFDHQIGEVVEVEGLDYFANSTYYITGTITVPDIVVPYDTITDGSGPFTTAPTLINGTADVEFLTGANAGLRRTITAVGGATVVTVLDPFPQPIQIGDEYRVIKRYAAAPTAGAADNILYLDDTTGFPASNFTVIIERGTEQEEVLYIGTNDIGPTPNTLTISNNDIGTAFCAKDHGSSFTVEAAQVLVPGCDWDIIETRATGEYTIAASAECVPQIDLNSIFLHDNVDLTKIVGGVPLIAHPLGAGIAIGDTEFTVLLEGANSFASALENVGDRDGILCRSLKVSGVAEEEVFATKQKCFSTVVGDYRPAAFLPFTYSSIEVEDASAFQAHMDVVGPFDIQISRYSSDSDSAPEPGVITVTTIIDNTLFIPLTPLTTNHHTGDPVELVDVIIEITDAFEFAHIPANDITLLYLDDIYRLEDPYNPGTFTDVPQGNLIEGPPLPSFLPIANNTAPPQPTKSIFPGSYVYNLPNIHYPINDQPSGYITRLASVPDATDITAAYKIPLTQQIIGSRFPADLTPQLGQDVGPGTIEILVADGRLFPDSIQNPFYVVLDHQRDREEIVNCVGKIGYIGVPGYPHAYGIQVDPLEVISFTHHSKKFTPVDPQIFIPSIVDLQVSKLVVSSVTGFGDDGGIFLDYGFNDNEKVLYPITITGTAVAPFAPADELVDSGKTFQNYYREDPPPGLAEPLATWDVNALIGARVQITAGAGDGQIRTITAVVDDTTLHVDAAFFPVLDATSVYRINGKFMVVDNSEVGTNLTHVGGVINNAGGQIVWHPAREGGVTQEYVKFSSKAGNILTLVQPTVFEKAHPPETQVILGTGTVGPKKDGSSYQPFLYTDFLTALFHKDVGNFGSLIKAAGIEIKAEDTDA